MDAQGWPGHGGSPFVRALACRGHRHGTERDCEHRVMSQTTSAATEHPGAANRARAFGGRLHRGDRIAHAVTFIFAATIILITALLFWELYMGAALTRQKFGWRFLTGTTWDPVALEFGALPFIYGTLVTSALALIIGIPLGIGAAIFLAELAPVWISEGLAFVIELL